MGIWRGLGSHTFEKVGNMPNSCTDRDQIWHTYAYYSGKVHELKKSKPLIPEGHGGLGGHQFIHIVLRMMVLCPERWAVRSLHSVYT